MIDVASFDENQLNHCLYDIRAVLSTMDERRVVEGLGGSFGITSVSEIASRLLNRACLDETGTYHLEVAR